ncbi:MAG TPA: hypothetical protein VFG04_13660 [Planctomycetaceae bacterium]|jgi:hypothetical protein|nr:hypothetical protein [Planctomycetaceae bacterium]
MRRLLRAARDRARRAKQDVGWALRRRSVAREIEPIAALPSRESLAGATLFFVPYAGVTPMLAQAAVVGRTLAERGHRVVFARCYRLFDRCPVMDMHKLDYEATPEQKLESCLRCADNSLSMLGEYGLPTIDLRSLVTPDMRQQIDQALAAAPPDLTTFEFDGVAFGRLSLMDVVLGRKISDFAEMTESDRGGWRDYLRSCLLSYLLVDRCCREFGISRVVHINDYSLLLGARAAARKHRAPCYCLAFPGHRNVDLSRYLTLSNVYKPIAYQLLGHWPACRDLCLEPTVVREVADDLIVRLRGAGSFIYSPGKTVEHTDVRSQFGLSTERRLIVAYTSSLDEMLASEMVMNATDTAIPDRPQPFRDQIEWLTALTRYVAASDDLQLVVRIHPREGANKREAVVSQHLAKLKRAFSAPPAHCRFVWPQEPVSSYDLGEAADLVLTSWSTIGLEMARLGAPVMVAFNGSISAIPQDDFLEWAPTPIAYFEKLRELLDRPVTLAQIARAFRWYALSILGATLDVSDVVPASNFAGLPEFRTPREAAALERIVIQGEDVCTLNIERLRAAQSRQSGERERDELARQLRRIVHFLMTGTDSTVDAPLTIRASHETNGAPFVSPAAPSGARLIELSGNEVAYRVPGRVSRRYSPMVARLAPLCGRELPQPLGVGARQ